MITFEHDGQTKGFSVVSESELEGFSFIPRPDFQNMFRPFQKKSLFIMTYRPWKNHEKKKWNQAVARAYMPIDM